MRTKELCTLTLILILIYYFMYCVLATAQEDIFQPFRDDDDIDYNLDVDEVLNFHPPPQLHDDNVLWNPRQWSIPFSPSLVFIEAELEKELGTNDEKSLTFPELKNSPSGSSPQCNQQSCLLEEETISNQLHSEAKLNRLFSIVKGRTVDQLQRATKIGSLDVDENHLLNDEEEESLRTLLRLVIDRELQECDLTIIADNSFYESRVMAAFQDIPNYKQISLLQNWMDLEDQIIWNSPRCHAVFFLLSDPGHLIYFGEEDMKYQDPWDYNARIIIAGMTLENLDIFLSTRKAKKTEQIIGIVKSKLDRQYKIYMNELYIRRDAIQITSWNGEAFTKGTDLFPDKILNLQKAPLNVYLFEWHPAIIYQRDNEGNVLLRYGRDVEIIRALSEFFNFTIIFKEPPSTELYGHRLPNGTFDGLVGLHGSGKSDLAVANLWYSANGGRLLFQEFSTPIAEDLGCFLARVDPPLPPWQAPTLPFQMITWLAIFIGLLLSGPLLYSIACQSDKSGPEEPHLQSFTISSLYSFGVHFSQPMAALPKCSGTKIFVAFLWTYSIILTTGYRSNLIAFLTVTKQADGIESFQDLYESGLSVMGIPAFKLLLTTTGNPYLESVAERFAIGMRFEDTKQDILEGKAVTINSKLYLEMVSGQLTPSREKQLFRIMKDCFSSYAVGVTYQRKSPLKPKFDQKITQMFESGLARRWFIESLRRFQQIKYEEEKIPEMSSEGRVEDKETAEGVLPLTMEHLEGVFIILAFGLAFSTCLFSLETFVGF